MNTTIIMPVRDAVKFTSEAIVREAIESVLNQSVSVEIIAISGNSQDVSRSIFERYNVRWIENSEANTGKMLNIGISETKTPYYMTFCPDDVLYEHYIESAEEKMEGYDIVGGHVQVIGKESRVWLNEGLSEKTKYMNTVMFSSLVRKSVWEKVGKYDEHIPYGSMEDWEFWIRCYLKGCKMSVIDECVYKWRSHDTNMSVSMAPHMEEIVSYYRKKNNL